jgi:hypothetical protein
MCKPTLPYCQAEVGGIVIMQGPATTLPAKGIARNCLIVDSATSVALAWATHGVSPAATRPFARLLARRNG